MSYSANEDPLISFVGVDSEDDIEALYDEVAEEAMLLGRLLEHNNARLIRGGIAQKVEAQPGGKITPIHSITTSTQFQVSRAHAFIPLPDRETDPGSVCVNVRNPRVTTIYEIGKRVMDGGEVASISVEPGFDEQDIILAGGLIDAIQAEVTAGKLPHLDTTLMNGLWVRPGAGGIMDVTDLAI